MRHFVFVEQEPLRYVCPEEFRWQRIGFSYNAICDALAYLCINPSDEKSIRFCILDGESGKPNPTKVQAEELGSLARGAWRPHGKCWAVVAVGRAVSARLQKAGIDHLALASPHTKRFMGKEHIWFEHAASVLLHSRKVGGKWRQF